MRSKRLLLLLGLNLLTITANGADKAPPWLYAFGGGMVESDSTVLNPPVQGSGLLPGHSVTGEEVKDCFECMTCCPEWPNYCELDFLVMTRTNNVDDQPLIISADDPDQVLVSARDLEFGVAPGVRALFGQRMGNNFGWEIGYTGVYGLWAEEVLTGEATLAAPGDLGQAVDGWSTADFLDPTYKSSLNLAEANLFYYSCGEKCKPNSALWWNRQEHCTCTDFLAGFVWAGLEEEAALNVICCEGDPPTSYNVDTSSNLFGGHIGIRKRADWERWSLQGTLKAGVAGTRLKSSSGAIFSSLTPDSIIRDPISNSESGLGGIFQFNLTTIYRINSQWGLRGGYNLIGLTGVALAPDQFDFTDTADSGTRIAGNGNVLMHGFNFGLEYRW
jgi:hypothetical protein